jgi:hypothetical protein
MAAPMMKKPAKNMKPAGKKAKMPFMGKESMKEEKMEKGKMPAFKKGGKVC